MQPTQNTVTGEKLSFIDLFRKKNYTIEVPIIQRDYAQGRKSKEKIRNTFLEALYSHLSEEKMIDLDFVYGTITGTYEQRDKFIPLDGQQRLTTLFLLHWYLAKNDGQSEIFDQFLLQGTGSRFTYETRTSSREFCDALVTNNFDLNKLLPPDKDKKNSLSKTIKNAFWYFLLWDDDPTIKGMLRMLDSIHEQFGESEGFFTRLVQSDNPVVTFQFLNLEHLRMTDDLYIKMNARGKALTDYENFKAQFIKFIENTHPQYHKLFADKIDGRWCDLFWDHAVTDGEKITYSLDDCIINYFDFITEMLFYRTSVEEGKTYAFDDFKLVEEIYKPVEHLEFLIGSLDILSKSRTGEFQNYIDGFFRELFTIDYEKGKIALFDGQVNLFEKLIYGEDAFEHKDKLLLFSLLYFLCTAKQETLTVTENLKDYTRVCRNFILKVNQKGNAGKKDEFVSDLRTSFYSDIMQTCITAYSSDVYKELLVKDDAFKFRKDNIRQEIRKAELIIANPDLKENLHKLEDHIYLKCDLSNLEPLLNNGDELAGLTETFYAIFGVIPDDVVIRSLLAVGDYARKIGNSYFGPLYFFGKREKWHRILTDNDDDNKLKPIFAEYFRYLLASREPTIEAKLEALTKRGLEAEKPDWIHLFLKYPLITKTSHSIFSFNDDGEFEVIRIDGTTLGSWHINSFIDAVNNSEELKRKPKYNGWVQDSVESDIGLRYSMTMMPRKDHWLIDPRSQDITALVDEFDLKPTKETNCFKLYANEEHDFVEIAIRFINTILP